MKAYQFVFNGHSYITPSKREYKAFRKLWAGNDWIGECTKSFKCWWKIEGIERAPGYIPISVHDFLEGRVEYEKIKS